MREKDAGNIYRCQIRMEEGTGGKTADTNHRGRMGSETERNRDDEGLSK